MYTNSVIHVDPWILAIFSLLQFFWSTWRNGAVSGWHVDGSPFVFEQKFLVFGGQWWSIFSNVISFHIAIKSSLAAQLINVSPLSHNMSDCHHHLNGICLQLLRYLYCWLWNNSFMDVNWFAFGQWNVARKRVVFPFCEFPRTSLLPFLFRQQSFHPTSGLRSHWPSGRVLMFLWKQSADFSLVIHYVIKETTRPPRCVRIPWHPS